MLPSVLVSLSWGQFIIVAERVSGQANSSPPLSQFGITVVLWMAFCVPEYAFYIILCKKFNILCYSLILCKICFSGILKSIYQILKNQSCFYCYSAISCHSQLTEYIYMYMCVTEHYVYILWITLQSRTESIVQCILRPNNCCTGMWKVISK